MVSTSDSVCVAAKELFEMEGAQLKHSPPGAWPSTAVFTTARSQVAHFCTARVGSSWGLAEFDVCDIF